MGSLAERSDGERIAASFIPLHTLVNAKRDHNFDRCCRLRK